MMVSFVGPFKRSRFIHITSSKSQKVLLCRIAHISILYYFLRKKSIATLVSNEAYKVAKDYSKNRSDLRAYYEVGKLLIEAQGGGERAKYGDRLIKEYAQK